jgi:hypothetical protein
VRLPCFVHAELSARLVKRTDRSCSGGYMTLYVLQWLWHDIVQSNADNTLRTGYWRSTVYVVMADTWHCMWQAYEGLQTVSKLRQQYIFIPSKVKEVYLYHILSQLEELSIRSVIIFVSTCKARAAPSPLQPCTLIDSMLLAACTNAFVFDQHRM